MKKKTIILIITTIVLAVIITPLLYALNVYLSAKDYKDTLSVDRETSTKTTVPENTPDSTSTSTPASTSVNETTAAKPPEETVEKEEEQFVGSNIINILFLGIDRNEERDKTLGIFRADSISLATINLDTKSVKVLSIPRDTYAFVPVENRKDKINHSYAFGSLKGDGVQATIDAVNRFIKYSKVDYYFSIDMQPIPEIVDTLGGVVLDSNVNIGSDIKKGIQLLNGEQALRYVRWRYSGNGDIDRIKRQMQFMKAMYNKVKEKDQLFNAIKLVLSYNKSVKTNMSVKQLAALTMLANDIPSDSIETKIIPGEDRKKDGIWYYFPDEEKTEEMLQEVFLKR